MASQSRHQDVGASRTGCVKDGEDGDAAGRNESVVDVKFAPVKDT